MVVLDRKRFRVLFLKALLLLTSIVISSKKEDVARSLILIVVAQACHSYLKAQPTGDGIKKNWFRIFGGFYYVQTQNGFHNSLYDLMDGKNYSKEHIRGLIDSYPMSYPAIISLEDQTTNRNSISVQWVPVKNLF